MGRRSMWCVRRHATARAIPTMTPDELALSRPISRSLPALTFAAAHSRRIKLGTGICLPERHPLHTAKLVASVDRLSQGRFVFGVGIGWLKEELQALGIPPERRAERTVNTSMPCVRCGRRRRHPFAANFVRSHR